MTPQQIWDGDLFDRITESGHLIDFIESVATRPSLREDGHAYVLAVDAPYGEGKSYFLRRFATHMALTHPVAFVDAWVDDLEDEPLVALAATLERAFDQFEDKSGELRQRINSFIRKTGKVAKIAAGGVFKRGIGLVITSGATDAAGAVIGSLSEEASKVVEESVTETIDGASAEITKIATPSMKARIERFNEGREAVDAMKKSLRDLVAYLGRDEVYPPPIVIVIDELDRCRPTYAIKLLEEIKHLFDVAGVAFVLGMHREALAHSVSAAYGTNFDGASYLKRFINRQYALQPAGLYPLMQWIFRQRDLDVARLACNSMRIGRGSAQNIDPARVVSMYSEMYGFNARDSFEIADAIETCLALTQSTSLYLPLLMPILLSKLRNKKSLLEPVVTAKWTLVIRDEFNNEVAEYSPVVSAKRLFDASRMDRNELMRSNAHSSPDWAQSTIAELTFNDSGDHARLSAPQNYEKLMATVGRFNSNPKSA